MEEKTTLSLEQEWEQATDTGELPERARFYQSVLDVDDLNSGGSYKDLKTSFPDL